MGMRIIVAGSREFNNYKLLTDVVDSFVVSFCENKDVTILSGTAKGADQLGEQWVKDRLENSYWRLFANFSLEKHPADWDKYGKRAGILRNEEMAKNADVLIAFWDGKSPGTKHMIKEALKNRLLVKVIQY